MKRSAVAAEADCVRPRGRESLFLGINGETQRFQRLDAENGLIYLPNQDRGRSFSPVDLENRDVGAEAKASAVRKADAHEVSRSSNSHHPRQSWRDDTEGCPRIHQHTKGGSFLRSKADRLVDMTWFLR